MPNIDDNFGPGAAFDHELRLLITASIRRSPKKREQIAEELTAMTGVRVTVHMLNDFTSEGKKPARFPLLFCAALCEILNDDSIGLFALRPRTRRLVEFAERELWGIRDQRERDALRESLLDDAPAKHGGR